MSLEAVFVTNLGAAQVTTEHDSVVVVRFFDVLVQQVFPVEGSRADLAQEQEAVLVVSNAAFGCQHRAAMLVADATLEFVCVINFYVRFLFDQLIERLRAEHAAVVLGSRFLEVSLRSLERRSLRFLFRTWLWLKHRNVFREIFLVN